MPLRLVALGLALVASLTASTSTAADPVVDFGRFPCRYNGRITTIETAAAALLRQISDRDHWFDAAGKRRAAAEWLLDDALSDADTRGPRIFEIRNPLVLEIVQLAPRPEPGPFQFRYAYDEIQPAFGALEATRDKAYPADVAEALHRLQTALRANNVLRLSLLTPPSAEFEQLRSFISGVLQLDAAALPAVVPPKSAAGRWSTFSRTAAEQAIFDLKPTDDFTPNPYGAALRAVFTARRSGDADAFAQAVAAYAALLQEKPPAAAPLSFEVPAEWRELGVPITPTAETYEDTLVAGAPVVEFATASAAGSCNPRLIYFPTPSASVERIMNHWRIQSGLAPLADAELRRTLTPVRIGDVDGLRADLTSTGWDGTPPLRVRTVVVRRETDTLVAMAAGAPESVAAEADRFDQFLSTVKLGPADALREWCNVGEPDIAGEYGPATSLVVVRDGADAWCFHLSGVQPLTDEIRAALREFVAKYPRKKSDFAAPDDWKMPAGWTATGASPMIFNYGAGEATRYLFVFPLQGFTPDSELPLLNDFRTTFKLPPWTPADLAAEVKAATIGQLETRTVEFTVAK